MINFKNYNKRYVSTESDFIDDIYKPAIMESIEYKRVTGYFSSSIIDSIYNEINNSNIKNGYKIKVICSPELSLNDKIAISEGYELKNIIEKCIVRTIQNIDDIKIPYISELIARDILDMKFVATKEGNGIFHAKEGIFIDEFGHKIAFIGSNNETSAAVKQNFETAVLFNTLENYDVIKSMEETFDQIWDNQNKNIVVCEITPIIRESFEKVKQKMIIREENTAYNRKEILKLYNLYPYQQDAINEWTKNNHIGLLEMATGTGKTITAIACQEVLQRSKDELITVIIAPQIDLVNQWYQEYKALNITPIKCNSNEGDYFPYLKSKLLSKSSFHNPIVIITTAQTFVEPKFQNIINNYLGEENLLICDEVHSFGSSKMRGLYSNLTNKFTYKLGVSATPYRKDEDETKELIEFFDSVVFKYSLKNAIENGFLNKYVYRPIVLSFSNQELDDYRYVVNNALNSNKKDLVIIKEIEKLTASIANANTKKVDKLKEIIQEGMLDKQKIVYCSPGNYNDGNSIVNQKHIKYVAKELNNIGCRLRMIYSDINGDIRMEILEQFKNLDINTLLAIKCLDQGVNLKEVTHAFILSSTDSLTEFIQRRGRILRTSPNKPISVIYDFIMLPEPIENSSFNPVIEDGYLVERELRRIKEYSYASENKEEVDNLIFEIENAYKDILEELRNDYN